MAIRLYHPQYGFTGPGIYPGLPTISFVNGVASIASLTDQQTAQLHLYGVQTVDDSLADPSNVPVVLGDIQDPTSDAGAALRAAYGSFESVKAHGAVMDGATDDHAAFAEAITALGATGGTVFVPPGVTAVGSTISVPSNVRIVGAGKNASVVKKTFDGVLFDFSGTDSSHRCQRGGMSDLQLNGANVHTGALVQANYADHLNFDRVWFYQNPDVAVSATELWDSYFRGCEWEWCGSATRRTGAVVHLMGSATDSTNEVWFSQCRWESFPCNAMHIDSNSLGHPPYGIYLQQCKMESNQINGANGGFIDMSNDVTDIHVRDMYLAADNLAAGGTAVAGLINMVAAANMVIEGIHAWVNNNAAQSVVRLFPGSIGHAIRDVFADCQTNPVNGVLNFAGGTPTMRVRNVRIKSSQTATIYGGTVPAGVLLEDKETTGTAAPTTGTWAVGDRVWNTAPAASGPPGWVCVSAGTPGTWKAMANLSA